METNIVNPPNGEDTRVVDDTKVLDTTQEGAGGGAQEGDVKGDSDFNYTPPKINLGDGEEGEGEKEKEVVAETPPTPPVAEKETVYVRISEKFDKLDEGSKKALNYALGGDVTTMSDFIQKIQEFAQKTTEIPVEQVAEIAENEERAISLISEDLQAKNPTWSKERVALVAKKEYDKREFEDDKQYYYEDLVNSVNQNRAKGLEGIDANIFGEFKAQQEQESIPELPYDSFQKEYLPKLGGGAIELPELVVKREDGSEMITFKKDHIAAITTDANNLFTSYLYNATEWNGKEWVLPETFAEKIGEEVKSIPANEWVEKRKQESLQYATLIQKGRNYDRDMQQLEKAYAAAAKKEMEDMKKDMIKRYTGLDKQLINEGGGEVKPLIPRPIWKEKTQT